MADIQLSERTHPYYDEWADRWELYYNSAKGGEEFINTENLFSHRLEDSEDYDERLDRAYFLNFCDTVPNIYNDYIFKENVERPPDEDLKLFRENCDGKGTPIGDFIKRVGYLSSVYGVVHVFVDIPSSTKKSPTKADDKAQGRIPFCKIIHPTQLKDWSVDEKGNFNWILIEYTHYQDLDPKKEREEQTHYKIVTREEWWIEDEDGNPVKFEDGSENKGQNTLGMIPMVSVYHKESEQDKIGESILKDIVYINRTIFNWCSCIDEQIERQTFSQLIIPDDGTLGEDAEKGADPLYKISTASGFLFQHDATHPPQYISPDVNNIQTIWKLTLDHIKEIFRLAGLQGGTSDLYTSRSGRQSQMSFLGVNSSLKRKSSSYETAENAISEMVYRHLGKNIEEYKKVKYPTSFDVVALAEEIDSMFRIMGKNFSETLNKEMLKDISRRSLPHITEDKRNLIESEIEAGDGFIEPESNSGITNEKQGDGNPNTDQGKSFKDKDTLDKEESTHRREE